MTIGGMLGVDHYLADFRRSMLQFCDEVEAACGPLDRLRKGVEILVEREPVRSPCGHRPHMFFIPGLPSEPFLDPAGFDWVPRLEAAAEAVLGELEALRDDSPAWSHYGDGVSMVEEKFSATRETWSTASILQRPEDLPATAALVRSLPLCGTHPLDAVFSRLRPGGRIPAHTGYTNDRIIAHLGLIIPEGCGIRVGRRTMGWSPRRVLVFDDCFEHEAWNGHGHSDRIVMIVRLRHPALDALEGFVAQMLIGRLRDYFEKLPSPELRRSVEEHYRIRYRD
jgi:hypothetical protein